MENVPTIDISPLLMRDNAKKVIESDVIECYEEIDDACRKWGFFYISNHGIPHEVVENFRRDMDSFFHLTSEQLDKIRRTQMNSRGFFDDELTKKKLDWKRGFDFGAQDGSLDNEGLDGFNQWPLESEHATFRNTMTNYFGVMESLSKVLLGAICKSLGFPQEALATFFPQHTSYLRLNYYPLCPDPESTLAIVSYLREVSFTGFHLKSFFTFFH